MSGRLILVVGPSGAGKDTLLAHAKEKLSDRPDILFPRRVITRAADATEDHEAVTEAAFLARQAAGGFALSWHAHGLSYGIPKHIEADLRGGMTVLVNVSRKVIGQARAAYSATVIEVTAPAATLRLRLQARGRENADDIEERLTRAVASDADFTIVNDSGIDEAVAELVRCALRIPPGNLGD
jgi:ribose 1,5-bisphosphokinase